MTITHLISKTKGNLNRTFWGFCDSIAELCCTNIFEEQPTLVESEVWPRITMGTYSPNFELDLTASTAHSEDLSAPLSERWPRVTLGTLWIEIDRISPEQELDWPRFTQGTGTAMAEANENASYVSDIVQLAKIWELWPRATQASITVADR